jgi:hypothetical protein
MPLLKIFYLSSPTKIYTVEPRFTNACHHEQIGLRTPLITNKSVHERLSSRTNRFTNASHHEQIGSRTPFITNKSVHERLSSRTNRFTNKFSEQKTSRVTNSVSSNEHASRQKWLATSWEYRWESVSCCVTFAQYTYLLEFAVPSLEFHCVLCFF